MPAAALAEVGYFIERDHGPRILAAFLDDIIEGAYSVDCGERDWLRIRELVIRYADLPLGLADAAVIACAERNGGRVATLDVRHFGVVAREGTFQIVS